jgi:GNAT superfamily N-acetyltransferase
MAHPDEGLRVDAMVREELARYSEWAPHWKLGPAPPEMIERLESAFADPERTWVLLAEKDGELIGVASLALTTGINPNPPPPGTVNLWQCFVRQDWQGRGVAGPLMDRALEEARERGFTRMVLWSAAGAAQARRFYEREGWTLTGEEEPEASIGLPLVQYALDL